MDLGEKFHSYCHTLGDASYAFYEERFDEDQNIDQIIHLPILFKIAVMDYAVKFGRWAIVGNSPLPESLAHLPPKFIQDKIDKSQFSRRRAEKRSAFRHLYGHSPMPDG